MSHAIHNNTMLQLLKSQYGYASLLLQLCLISTMPQPLMLMNTRIINTTLNFLANSCHMPTYLATSFH